MNSKHRKPSPDDIKKADLTKLHTELNQYINQRVLITTASIAFYGAFLGLVFSSRSPDTFDEIDFLLFIGLVFILFILYFFCRVIGGNIQVIATYLRHCEMSSWENDVKEFRDKRAYLSQEEIIPAMFASLGVCAIASVIFLPVDQFSENTSNYRCAAFLAALLYTSMCSIDTLWKIRLVIRPWFNSICTSWEKELDDMWAGILKGPHQS